MTDQNSKADLTGKDTRTASKTKTDLKKAEQFWETAFDRLQQHLSDDEKTAAGATSNR